MLQTGKLDPHPEETHPRVKLVNHLTLPPSDVPAVIDWHSKVPSYPMLLNDRLGDCTSAGWWHLVQTWTAYAGSEFVPTDQNALDLYELFGYNPANTQPDGSNPSDQGAVEQDVLGRLAQAPVDGHGCVAFAQVDHTSADEMKAALAVFGGLYVGIQCPQSMQQQFGAGDVIDYVPGSPVEGGHCIVIVGWDADYIYVVTWGEVARMTWNFWAHYGDEAWVVVTKDFIEANGMSPTGLSLATMLTDFHQITGSPVPSPRHAAAKPSVWQRILNWLRAHV